MSRVSFFTPTAAPGHPIALSSLIEIVPESLKYSYRKSKVKVRRRLLGLHFHAANCGREPKLEWAQWPFTSTGLGVWSSTIKFSKDPLMLYRIQY